MVFVTPETVWQSIQYECLYVLWVPCPVLSFKSSSWLFFFFLSKSLKKKKVFESLKSDRTGHVTKFRWTNHKYKNIVFKLILLSILHKQNHLQSFTFFKVSVENQRNQNHTKINVKFLSVLCFRCSQFFWNWERIYSKITQKFDIDFGVILVTLIFNTYFKWRPFWYS